jgi:hypothetical protein
VAQGLTSSCRVSQRAKGTDLRRLWILEEAGFHLQEGVPPCSSGMVQRKRLQENLDPGKLWTMDRLSWQEDDPPCVSCMVNGTWAPETRKRRYCTENPEGMDVQDETQERPRMQNQNKGPRHKMTATS